MEGKDMRTIVAAILIATGIGIIAVPSGSAAPVNGAALDRDARAVAPISPVGYVLRHGHICYAKCYYDFFVGHRVCRRFC